MEKKGKDEEEGKKEEGETGKEEKTKEKRRDKKRRKKGLRRKKFQVGFEHTSYCITMPLHTVSGRSYILYIANLDFHNLTVAALAQPVIVVYVCVSLGMHYCMHYNWEKKNNYSGHRTGYF